MATAVRWAVGVAVAVASIRKTRAAPSEMVRGRRSYSGMGFSRAGTPAYVPRHPLLESHVTQV